LGPGEDAASLYARADAALYAAKREGRDRTVIADP
jgi:PleD family two-component response regulator